MWCLTLATNAVVTWTTEYNGLAVTALHELAKLGSDGYRPLRAGTHTEVQAGT